MKKSLLTSVIILLVITGYSQLNNSWIDYTKTYYRFRVYSDTLCRIYQPALPPALASTPAQNFQLWRNGKEIRMYTSVATGVLAAACLATSITFKIVGKKHNAAALKIYNEKY